MEFQAATTTPYLRHHASDLFRENMQAVASEQLKTCRQHNLLRGDLLDNLSSGRSLVVVAQSGEAPAIV